MSDMGEARRTLLIGAKSCRTCEWRHKQAGVIFCRRFPPQVFIGMAMTPKGPQPSPLGTYPQVNPDIPCGEYQRNEAHAVQEVEASGPIIDGVLAS